MSARPHDGGFRARRRTCVTGLGALAVAGAMPASFAQQASTNFPNKLVRIIPFGAGGGPLDVLARVYADKLQQRWGQSVIVEPKPGASGIIAANYVAKAPPDGYTALMTLPLTHINNAILMPKLPYDPVKDFEPVSQIGSIRGPVLVARADAPYSNLKEFVAYAKAHPGMTYGTWGNGSQPHLMGELLKQQAGITLTHVAYKTEAAAHNDMFGGSLDFAWASTATAFAQSQARGGKMKLLGVVGSRRSSLLPEVPTFTEWGFKGFDLDSWIGFYLPARTPAAIIGQWNQALRDVTHLPEVRTRLVSSGYEPLANTPAEFKANYKADFPRVAELIKAAGVTAE